MSALTLTIAALRAHDACDLKRRIADITRSLGRQPGDDEAIDIRTWWSPDSTTIADRWWSLRAANPW